MLVCYQLMNRARYPTDLTDVEWRVVAPHLPEASPRGRVEPAVAPQDGRDGAGAGDVGVALCQQPGALRAPTPGRMLSRNATTRASLAGRSGPATAAAAATGRPRPPHQPGDSDAARCRRSAG